MALLLERLQPQMQKYRASLDSGPLVEAGWSPRSRVSTLSRSPRLAHSQSLGAGGVLAWFSLRSSCHAAAAALPMMRTPRRKFSKYRVLVPPCPPLISQAAAASIGAGERRCLASSRAFTRRRGLFHFRRSSDPSQGGEPLRSAGSARRAPAARQGSQRSGGCCGRGPRRWGVRGAAAPHRRPPGGSGVECHCCGTCGSGCGTARRCAPNAPLAPDTSCNPRPLMLHDLL